MKTSKAVDLFIQSRLSKNLSPMTVKWYVNILDKFITVFRDIPKRPGQLESFLIYLNVGDERRHGYYRALKAFYGFLQARKYIKKNPVKELEEPLTRRKDPPIHTPEQLNRLLAYPHPIQIRASLVTFIDTGIRLGELHTLQSSNLLETPDGFIALVNGKTGMRPVPISYESYHGLMVSLPFQVKKGTLGRWISKACKDAGIQGSAVTLRHTFATLWDGDELVLQQIMGHSTLSTTRRYRHLRTQNLLRQHSVHSPLKMILSTSKSLL